MIVSTATIDAMIISENANITTKFGKRISTRMVENAKNSQQKYRCVNEMLFQNILVVLTC